MINSPSVLTIFISRYRRVKCDEQNPACQKCTYTGRKCDGYKRPIAFGSLSREPVIHISDDAQERKTFLPPNCNCKAAFWRFRVQLLVSSCPSGQSYKFCSATYCSSSRISPQEFINHRSISIPQLGSNDNVFALHQYTKAMDAIKKALNSGAQPEIIILICCTLFQP